MTQKYVESMPLYRQEQKLARLGIKLSDRPWPIGYQWNRPVVAPTLRQDAGSTC
jgi:hypothetical protein